MNTILLALSLCKSKGKIIVPPTPEELELNTKEYSDFKKLFTQNLGKWKGGKKQYFEFPFNTETLLKQLQNGEKPNFKQDWHYFPTPSDVIEEMFNTHIPLYDGDFLEPSAGQGAIVDGILELGARNHKQTWDCVEMEPTNRKILKTKGFNLVGENFDDFETEKRYDAIFANPPFKRDLPHVKKMISLLKPHGSLVCIVPYFFLIRSNCVREINVWKEKFEVVDFRRLGNNRFKESGTRIDTSILHIRP